jgi:hypothetical protein
MKTAPKGEAVRVGSGITAGMIRQIKEESICDGSHIMTTGREEVLLDPFHNRLEGDRKAVFSYT